MTFSGSGIYLSRDRSRAFAVVPSAMVIDGNETVECVEVFGRSRLFAELPAFNFEWAGDLPPDLDLVECVDGDWTDVSRDDDPSDDPTLPKAGRHYLVTESRKIGEGEWLQLRGRHDWLNADAFKAVR